MAIIRSKEIKAMPKEELTKKMEDLKLELIKATKPSHGSSIKNREIRRTIARILTNLNGQKNGQKQEEEKGKGNKDKGKQEEKQKHTKTAKQQKQHGNMS